MSSRAPFRIGWADVALAFVCVPPTIAGAFNRDGEFGAVHVAIVVVTVALLLLRRRAPVPVLVAGLIALIGAVVITERPNGLFPAVIVLVFAVAVRNERRVGIAAGGAALVALIGSIAILAPHGLVGPEVLAALAWPAFAVAAADVVRSRRAAIDAAEERVRRAEETREEEARRRVAEERLRIARELHDVVAHRMAVVNVQAGVAAHLLRIQPDDAERALQVVRTSAQLALTEFGGILEVLRTTGDSDVPVDPAPTVADLPALVRSFEDAGLAVTWETSGAPRVLGESAQLAVYRTVQEGLTNAHKHGDGCARLAIRYTADHVDVVIENPVPAGTDRLARAGGATTGGFGLVGMRERVHAAGGELSAGPGGDGFRVAATFPVGPGISS